MDNSDIPSAEPLLALSLSDKICVYDMSKQPNGERSMTVGSFLQLAINQLPPTNPEVEGELWINNGILTVSAGEEV